MSVKTYLCSHFFTIGCEAAFGDLINMDSVKECDYLFVDFSFTNIAALSSYEWIVSLSRYKVILISDVRLLPLAAFFQERFTEIVAIFTCHDSIEHIGFFIKTYDNGQERKEVNIEPLSEAEFLCMSNILKGVSVSMEAKIKKLHVKTIYSRRRKVGEKLGVRKLSSLYTFFVDENPDF
ncbi:hypothetical protein Z042_08780 [Chania multitudinisentens RB-25]|uniref:HTH luxR-type domain-containing protein n=1 Tax=Chania multitudinisentens RB-25 TaxID=1441930 RepID=W0LJW4_9GAMM|nr:hypothetical protein [Chania multitudinisentens]AHG22724.1 hypothetical protein Z042_08780 [Chania multitudinisentens RB-25]